MKCFISAFKIIAFIGIVFFLLKGVGVLFAAYQFYNGPSEKLLSKTGYKQENMLLEGDSTIFKFEPNYPFWSDGAKKRRYMYLPENIKIDTSNQSQWNFPKGTRIWKNFERDNILVETRMLYKFGSNINDWDMSAYQWREDFSDADKVFWGGNNVSNTDHDIPSPSQCVSCHGDGLTKRPLGISAIQLPWKDEDSLSIVTLNKQNKTSHPIATEIVLPGNAITQKALGYLHANCGSCHSEGSTFVPSDITLRLNLDIDTLKNVNETNLFRTAVNKPSKIKALGTNLYVNPGEPSSSFIFKRMSIRDQENVWQMPPIATEIEDQDGSNLIRNWIEQVEHGK